MLSMIAALLLLPLGIVAWTMGSKDLKAMDRGQVDPSGRSLTQMGRVFGIAGVVVTCGQAVLICTNGYWAPALYRIL
jgi:hypothetical protein